MNKYVNEMLLKMNTDDFLANIKNAFDKVFSDGNIKKINIMSYISENDWLNIKKAGLLLPFLPEKFGGRKDSQFEIQEVLRIAGSYGVPITLRTGIEGALVLQPLTEFGNTEQIEEGLELIFAGEGGGLAITEPNTSGSAIAREMQSYYEYRGDGTVHVKADKYWQGNSQSEFLLVAAKEKKAGRLSKVISLVMVPKRYITHDVLSSEGLKAVRYAINHIDSYIPEKYVINLSGDRASSLREFQNIFIRSRLQLVGMTHGIMECLVNNIREYTLKGIPFVERELEEIDTIYGISKIMYDYTCNNVDPVNSVSDKLLEANIIKSLATEYTYSAARTAQKLLGAKGFETGHPISNIAIDFRPFTIFEGPNDMLYAEIYDQFSRSTSSEKASGVKIHKTMTIYERLLNDLRYSRLSFSNNINSSTDFFLSFLKGHALYEIRQIDKVPIGKILARIFLLFQTESEKIKKFLIRDIQKDILDFKYY